MFRHAFCGMLLAGLLSWGAAASAQDTGNVDSGIMGSTYIGPIRSGGRTRQPLYQPYPGALIDVASADGSELIGEVQSDENGHFEVLLPPGTYMLLPVPPNPRARFPRAARQVVHVPAASFANVNVVYNTGMR